MLSKEAYTQGGQFPKNLTRQSLWPTPGRRPWEAHLSENGGFIGRLVLLLLLSCSFLHLLPVRLLFPVSSFWLQMQSTGLRLVQSRQRRLLEEDPGLSGGPQSLHTPASPEAQKPRQDVMDRTAALSLHRHQTHGLPAWNPSPLRERKARYRVLPPDCAQGSTWKTSLPVATCLQKGTLRSHSKS